MKFALLFIFLFLFSTGCGLFKDKKNADSEETKKIKIHRKNEFTPKCDQNKISNKVTCGLGQAVCGIEFEDSDIIKVYCVDADNTRLATALCCKEYDDACKKRTIGPIVILEILAPVPNCSPSRPKIQKNSAFTPDCDGGPIVCQSGNPACGTKPGSGDLKVYCIDTDDTILETAAYCGDIDNYIGHREPRCVQLVQSQ